MDELLNLVKDQKWFYEFVLPDGTTTQSYLPEVVRGIHVTREKALRYFLSTRPFGDASAIDVACHEGYFSLLLSEFFARVTGIDKNPESISKARQMASLLRTPRVAFSQSSLEDLTGEPAADFILCFGLVYHVENPVQVFRGLARLARRALCLETQVLPLDVAGRVEDGSFLSQRELQGL